MYSNFRLKKILLFVFPCLSVVLNLEIHNGVYFSTLMLAIFFFIQWLSGKIYQRQIYFYVGAIYLLWVVLFRVVFFEGDLSVLRNEYLKLVILLFGTGALIGLPERTRNYMVVCIPWILLGYMIVVYMFLDWNRYDLVRNRFSVPSIGSPNSLGFILAICLILMHYQKSIIFRRENLGYYICYLGLLLGLIATQSRGGVVIYLIGIVLIQRNNIFTFALYSVMALLFLGMFVDLMYPQNLLGERFNLVQDLAATGGTGRIEIWSYLVDELLDAPGSFLFGLGSVQVELFGVEILSAHSIFMNIFYCFGIFGVLALIIFILWGAILVFGSSGERKKYRKAIFFMLVAGVFFDSYILNAQIFWFTCLILAFVYGVEDKKYEGSVKNLMRETI